MLRSCACLAVACLHAAPVTPIQPRVDARIELVSTIFMLAEVRGYTECKYPEYQARVLAQFAPFKDHPAVLEARRLAKERYMFLGGPLSLALHWDSEFRLDPRARPQPNRVVPPASGEPVVPEGGTLDFRWTLPLAEHFSTLARDFAEKSRFRAFMATERPFHQAIEMALAPRVQAVDLRWHQATFHRPPTLCLLTSPLLGGGNFGPDLLEPSGRRSSGAIMGSWDRDAAGQPRFRQRAVESILVHEALHPCLNPFVDRWMDLLRPAAEAVTLARPQDWARTGYQMPRFTPDFLYESIVRAAEVLYYEARNPKEGAAWLQMEQERGWTWLPEVVEWLRETVAKGRLEQADGEPARDLAARLRRVGTAVPAPSLAPPSTPVKA